MKANRLYTLLFLMGCVGVAEGQDVFLDVNGFSKHSQETFVYQGQQETFNGDNAGLGVTAALSKHIDLKVGFYDNSYFHTTVYGGVNVKTEFSFGQMKFVPGVTVGLATGYDNTPMHSGLFQLYVIPNIGIRFGSIGVTVGYIPGVSLASDSAPVSVVTAQFQYQIK